MDFSSKEGKTKLAALAVPLIKKIPGDMLRLSLRNTLAQKLGILDQAQLESLIPSYSEMKITASPQPVKRTPMRVLIGLLLQNPELAQLVPDLSPYEN